MRCGLAGSALTISRALCDVVETTIKSGQVRRGRIGDDAASLERVPHRQHLVGPEKLIFGSPVRGRLDGSALRHRYKCGVDTAGLRRLGSQDLRHSYGSLLVAGDIGLVCSEDAIGHAQLTTRALPTRVSAKKLAAKLTDALRSTAATPITESQPG